MIIWQSSVKVYGSLKFCYLQSTIAIKSLLWFKFALCFFLNIFYALSMQQILALLADALLEIQEQVDGENEVVGYNHF